MTNAVVEMHLILTWLWWHIFKKPDQKTVGKK